MFDLDKEELIHKLKESVEQKILELYRWNKTNNPVQVYDNYSYVQDSIFGDALIEEKEFRDSSAAFAKYIGRIAQGVAIQVAREVSTITINEIVNHLYTYDDMEKDLGLKGVSSGS